MVPKPKYISNNLLIVEIRSEEGRSYSEERLGNRKKKKKRYEGLTEANADNLIKELSRRVGILVKSFLIILLLLLSLIISSRVVQEVKAK